MSIEERFRHSLFDVEHALSLYATSFFYLPANNIYDKKILKQHEEIYKNCHIYIIGYLPKISLIAFHQVGNDAVFEYMIGLDKHNLILPIPHNYILESDDSGVYAIDLKGKKEEIGVSEKVINQFLQQHSKFEVKYIGQAYGKDGSRNALDRLVKHETLQKIALTGVPEGKTLQLLLLEVEPSTQLITAFNPFAKNKDESGLRITAGLDKLFNTSESERISIYEAALIRYFYPQFNKEFKDSFPSTQLKVLQDCYKKDFSMVVAEIVFDCLPFQLCSELVKPSWSHMARHDLHDDKQRKAFFYGSD